MRHFPLPYAVNGPKVAEAALPHPVPNQFSISEGFDIGEDVGSAVDFTYTPPFPFTGGIDQVTVALEPGPAPLTFTEATPCAIRMPYACHTLSIPRFRR